jgi:WD40 repeat protein
MTGRPARALPWLAAFLVLVAPCAGAAPGQQPAPEKAPPRRDAFGDPLPLGAITRLGTLRFTGNAPPIAAALSRDGALLATASMAADHVLSLWDTRTGRELHRLAGHDGTVHALAFAPDGNRLYSGNDGRYPFGGHARALIVWDTGTGKQVRRFPCQGWALSGDGKVLAVGVPRELAERAAGVGKRVPVYTGIDVHYHDTATWEKIRTFYEPKEVMVGLALSHDGGLFAYGNPMKGTLRIVQRDGGKVLHRLEGPPGHVHLLAFSPDGKVLASSSEEPSPRGRDRQIVLWDVASGKDLRRLAGHPQPLGGLAFSPDGRSLASFSERDGVRQWDAASGAELRQVQDAEAGRAVGAGFSADSRDLTTVSGHSLLIVVRDWDAATGKLRPGESPRDGQPYRSLTFSPDGRTVAAASKDGSVRLFDAETGKPSGRLAGADRSGVQALAFIPDGNRLVAGGGSGTVQIWDAAAGKEALRFTAGAEGVHALALSPDGKTLAIAGRSSESRVALWDLKNGREVVAFEAGADGAYALAFLPDGKTIAAGCRDGAVRLFDAKGKEIRKFARDKHHIFAFALSPDGALLVTRGHRRESGFKMDDPGLRLWDVATGREVGSIVAQPPDRASSFAFSADGRTLAVAAEGARLRLYEVATRQMRRDFSGGRSWLGSVAYAPDGLRVGSLQTDGTALLWDVTGLLGQDEPRKPPRPADLEALWKDLNGSDVKRAYAAVCALAASPAVSVPYLDRRVTAVAPLNTKDLPRLLRELAGKDLAVRTRATRDLERFGPLAEPQLREVLDGNPPLETRQRVLSLLAGIQARPYAPAQVSAFRLVEALELADTPAARAALERLRERGQPQYREPAAAALERMARRAP